MINEEILDDILTLHKEIHTKGFCHNNKYDRTESGEEFLFFLLGKLEDQLVSELEQDVALAQKGDYYHNIFNDYINNSNKNECIFRLNMTSTNKSFNEDFDEATRVIRELESDSNLEHYIAIENIQYLKTLMNDWTEKNVLFIHHYELYKGKVKHIDVKNEMIEVISDSGEVFNFPRKQFSYETCDYEFKSHQNWKKFYNGRISFLHLDR